GTGPALDPKQGGRNDDLQNDDQRVGFPGGGADLVDDGDGLYGLQDDLTCTVPGMSGRNGNGAVGSPGGLEPLASRARRTARARLRCISACQPPATSEPRKRIASGTQRYGVGSLVPPQSKSRRNRGRSVRVELKPWLTASGSIRSWRSWRTWRNPDPLGVQSH